MGRRPVFGDRPPAFVSRETGAAELDLSVDEWNLWVRSGYLPRPKNGKWWWPDIEARIDPQRPRADRTGCIYFIGFGPYVKIGFTLKPIWERLARLQTAAPEPLAVLAMRTGPQAEERCLQSRFSSYRTHGEWFRHEGDLAVYIQSLQAGDSGHG